MNETGEYEGLFVGLKTNIGVDQASEILSQLDQVLYQYSIKDILMDVIYG